MIKKRKICQQFVRIGISVTLKENECLGRSRV